MDQSSACPPGYGWGLRPKRGGLLNRLAKTGKAAVREVCLEGGVECYLKVKSTAGLSLKRVAYSSD